MTRRDEALLAGLADGVLAGGRRERAERIPGATQRAERQRRVARALAAGPVAPQTVAGVAARSTRARAGPGARLAVAGLAAALLAALALVLPNQSPSVDDAARLAELPARQGAPPGAGGVLRVSHAGLAFPDWNAEFGWRATGSRADRLGERPARTVFYEHHGHRIGYTIVSGPVLRPPPEARRVRRGGLEIALYRDPRHGGHDVAVFVRGGRTCVLAGHVENPDTLVRLAAWAPRA